MTKKCISGEVLLQPKLGLKILLEDSTGRIEVLLWDNHAVSRIIQFFYRLEMLIKGCWDMSIYSISSFFFLFYLFQVEFFHGGSPDVVFRDESKHNIFVEFYERIKVENATLDCCIFSYNTNIGKKYQIFDTVLI